MATENPVVKYQRKGTNKYTLISNFQAIAMSIKRKPELLCKFFSLKLEATQVKSHLCSDGRLVITNKLSLAFVSNIISEFIQNFVVCRCCSATDTCLRLASARLCLFCNKCQQISAVEHSYALNMYRYFTRQAKQEARDKLNKVTEKQNLEDPKPGMPQEEEDNGDPQPAFPVSRSQETTVHPIPSLEDMIENLRMRESMKAMEVTEMLEWAQDQIFERDLSTIEIVPLFWKAFIESASHCRSAIQRRGELFRATVDFLVPFDASLLFLGCIEASLRNKNEHIHVLAAAMDSVIRILKALLEQRVLDSDTIIGWLEGDIRAAFTDSLSSEPLSSDIKQKLRERCRTFIEYMSEEHRGLRLPKVSSDLELPKVSSDLEAFDLDYIKLDLVRPKLEPLAPALRQQSGVVSEWSEVEQNSIGADWMFLEDAL